jgi:uncharacterized membrane protein YeiH
MQKQYPYLVDAMRIKEQILSHLMLLWTFRQRFYFCRLPLSFINIIEILGTFSFAASGAFAAMERKLDPFGVLIISFATAIGGGTIRDLLIGDLPVAWLNHSTTIWVIVTAALITIFFGSYLKKLDRMLFLFDAIGLGLFTMVGIQKGLTHGFSMGISIMLGTITGCFGGVLRDVLLNNVPLIFQKEIYASASILGGLLFFLMLFMGVGNNPAYILVILTVFFIRILAVRYNWSLPKFYENKE